MIRMYPVYMTTNTKLSHLEKRKVVCKSPFLLITLLLIQSAETQETSKTLTIRSSRHRWTRAEKEQRKMTRNFRAQKGGQSDVAQLCINLNLSCVMKCVCVLILLNTWSCVCGRTYCNQCHNRQDVVEWVPKHGPPCQQHHLTPPHTHTIMNKTCLCVCTG